MINISTTFKIFVAVKPTCAGGAEGSAAAINIAAGSPGHPLASNTFCLRWKISTME